MLKERYAEWIEASKELQRAKKRELELRLLICGDLLKGKLEGQVTIKDEGYKIVPKAVLNRTLDEEVLTAIWDKLDDAQKSCIHYKPVLIESKIREYEEHGGLIMEAITVKPGTPQLKIEELG